MKSQKRKWLGALGVMIATGMTCSLPYQLSKNAERKRLLSQQSNTLPSKVSGYIERGEDCGTGPINIVFQGTYKDADILVETVADQTGYFSIVAPGGEYILTAKSDRCEYQQTFNLLPSTEQLYSIVMVEVDDTQQAEVPALLGGRLPASLLAPSKDENQK